MKRTWFFVLVLSLVPVSVLDAQTNQGQWMLGISSRFSLNPLEIGVAMPDMMTIGYSTIKVKSDDNSDPEAIKFTCVNLQPKFGYFVIDNLAVGLDVQFGMSSLKSPDDDKDNGTVIGAGPFVRYYFPSGKILPYVEGGATFGSMKTKYEYSGDTEEYKSGLNTWNLGAGITKSISEKAALDFMLGYLSTTMKDKEDNDNNARTVIGTIGFKFGIVVFLGSKKEAAK
jgi:opacity protein-like surface antigen